MAKRADELVHCTLCGRMVPGAIITEHHLLPKEEGGTEEHKVPMCRPCHGHIHASYDNRTLAKALSTLAALRRDAKIARFVKFIRKQDASSVFRSDYSVSRPRKKR